MNSKDILNDIELRLRNKNIRKQEVAEHFGVTDKAVWEWFKGKPGNMSLNKIIELADMVDAEIIIVDKREERMTSKDILIGSLRQIINVIEES